MPKLQKALTMIHAKTKYDYDDYQRLLQMMMDMKGLTNEQAEEEFLKMLMKDMPSFETAEDMNAVMAGVQKRIMQFTKDLEPKHSAFMAQKTWNDLAVILKESPAYDKLSKYFKEYYNIQLDVNPRSSVLRQ